MIATAVLTDMPPPAPRPFRARALDGATSFQLLFGAIWMFVGGSLTALLTLFSSGFPILFPLAFCAAGAVVFAFGLHRLRALRAIYVHGQAVRAEVTSVTPTAIRINRRRIIRIHYAFDTIMGRFTGSTTAVNAPTVGDTLWVLHLPSEPKRSVAA
jgi:hypothetical protein